MAASSCQVIDHAFYVNTLPQLGTTVGFARSNDHLYCDFRAKKTNATTCVCLGTGDNGDNDDCIASPQHGARLGLPAVDAPRPMYSFGLVSPISIDVHNEISLEYSASNIHLNKGFSCPSHRLVTRSHLGCHITTFVRGLENSGLLYWINDRCCMCGHIVVLPARVHCSC